MHTINIITAVICGIVILWVIINSPKMYRGAKAVQVHTQYFDTAAVHYDLDNFKVMLIIFFKDIVVYDLDVLRLLLYSYLDRAIDMVQKGVFPHHDIESKVKMIEYIFDESIFEPLLILEKDKNSERKEILLRQWNYGFFFKFEKDIAPSFRKNFVEMEKRFKDPNFSLSIADFKDEISSMRKIITLVPESSLRHNFYLLSEACIIYLENIMRKTVSHSKINEITAHWSNEVNLFQIFFEKVYDKRRLEKIKNNIQLRRKF